MASQPNPKDSMKSTWRTADRKTWTREHWSIDLLNAYHVDLDKPVPVHSKTDKIPYMPQWSQQSWIMFYALLPVALQQLVLSVLGWQGLRLIPGGQTLKQMAELKPLHWGVVLVFYFLSFTAIIVREVHMLRRLGHIYGFLDGDEAPRDGVPDVGVKKVAASLYKTLGTRLAMTMFLTFDAAQAPLDAMASWQWWAKLYLQIGMYGIAIDFWFYLYHRGVHEIKPLWKYHRTHHLTKHPNPLLSAYADSEQEFIEMVAVPFLAYSLLSAVGLPLGFYDWWICHLWIAYTEVAGHSGIRAHLSPPSTLNWLLRLTNTELAVEDHDLHHRKGWRKSYNYGKQTRIWDRLFGTCHHRIESATANVDYVNTAYMPIF